jgi:predicted transcriptional regulator
MAKLTDDEQELLKLLVEHMDSSGLEMNSIETLAVPRELDERRVNQCLAELDRRGFIALPESDSEPHARIVWSDQGLKRAQRVIGLMS